MKKKKGLFVGAVASLALVLVGCESLWGAYIGTFQTLDACEQQVCLAASATTVPPSCVIKKNPEKNVTEWVSCVSGTQAAQDSCEKDATKVVRVGCLNGMPSDGGYVVPDMVTPWASGLCTAIGAPDPNYLTADNSCRPKNGSKATEGVWTSSAATPAVCIKVLSPTAGGSDLAFVDSALKTVGTQKVDSTNWICSPLPSGATGAFLQAGSSVIQIILASESAPHDCTLLKDQMGANLPNSCKF